MPLPQTPPPVELVTVVVGLVEPVVFIELAEVVVALVDEVELACVDEPVPPEPPKLSVTPVAHPPAVLNAAIAPAATKPSPR